MSKMLPIIFTFVSTVILLISNPAQAEAETSTDWQLFTKTTNGSIFIKDIEAMKDKSFNFWLKTENGEIEGCRQNPNPFLRSPIAEVGCDSSRRKKIKATVTNMELSCKTKRIRNLEGVSYNYFDEVLFETAEESWKRIFPDTVGQSLYLTFCVR